MAVKKYIRDNFWLVVFLLFIAVFFTRPFEFGGDFYHHVNTGREILEFKQFPFTDSLTYTLSGKPWIAYAWGSGIILYLIYNFTGQLGIVLFVTSVALLTFLLLYIWLRSLNINRNVAVLSLFLASPILALRFPNRPEIFTYPFMAALLLIDSYRNKHPRLNLLLPLIILLWANLYGSSTIAGLGLILLFIVKQLLIDKGKLPNPQRLFYICALPSIPIAFLNPNTYKSIFYLFDFIPQVAQYEGEWGSIRTILYQTPGSYVLGFQYVILIYLIYLTAFLTLCIFSFRQLKKTNIFFILLAYTIFVPIFAFRQTPLAVILSLPILAICLYEIKKPGYIFLIGLVGVLMASLSLWLKPIGIYSDSKPTDNLVSFILFIFRILIL